MRIDRYFMSSSLGTSDGYSPSLKLEEKEGELHLWQLTCWTWGRRVFQWARLTVVQEGLFKMQHCPKYQSLGLVTVVVCEMAV